MLDRANVAVVAAVWVALIAAPVVRAHDAPRVSPRETALSAESLLSQGEADYRNGEFDEAKRLLEGALRLSPHSARAHALLGLTLARRGDLQGAILNLEQACKIDPANPDFAYDEAVLLLQTHRYASAIPILERLNRRASASDDVRVNLVRAYAATGNVKELSKSISTLPPAVFQNEALLKALASVLAEAKQPAALEQLWESAIRRDPEQPLPYAALAKLWIARKEPARALTVLEGAPPGVQGPLYLYALGETQQALGKYDEARGSFRQLVHQVPENEEAWQQLVHSDLLANHLAEARQDALRASRQFPRAALFPYQLAVIDYVLGKNAAAIEDLAPVLKNGSQKDPRLALLMAVLQSAGGNYQEASRYFQRAEALDSACNALTSYFYGTTLLRMHRPQDAVVQLRGALRCQPHFALAQYRLGVALSQGGNPHEALAALQQAVRDDPTLAEPYYALAQVQRRMGQARAAQASLARFNALHQRVNVSDRDLFREGVH